MELSRNPVVLPLKNSPSPFQRGAFYTFPFRTKPSTRPSSPPSGQLSLLLVSLRKWNRSEGSLISPHHIQAGPSLWSVYWASRLFLEGLSLLLSEGLFFTCAVACLLTCFSCSCSPPFSHITVSFFLLGYFCQHLNVLKYLSSLSSS